MNECKLCRREVTDELFVKDYGICYFCGSELNSLISILPEKISEYQASANASTDPNERIKYLSLMLDLLYEYKVKYVDNDVDVIEQDIDELIYSVIDAISYART